MILTLKAWIQKRKLFSDKECAISMEIDKSVLMPMLELLSSKGYIDEISNGCGKSCKGCFEKCEEKFFTVNKQPILDE